VPLESALGSGALADGVALTVDALGLAEAPAAPLAAVLHALNVPTTASAVVANSVAR